MKKIYLFAFSAVLALGASAQAQQVVAKKKQFTREEIVQGGIIVRQDRNETSSLLRTTILSEDFQGVAGTLPAALPSGWSCPTVTTIIDGGDDPNEPIIDVASFMIEDAASAVAGGYWPVPELGGANRFAGANDDSDPCDCDNADTWLQSPAMDFSAATNPALIFDIFHDQGFGGGDAVVQVSLDMGTTWTNLAYSGTDTGVLPVDESVWQTVIFLLPDYAGESSVTLRFQWTDNGTWASGFAVDNIEVGDLEANNLKNDKVVFGNWFMEDFLEGFWDYSMIPVVQASPISATSIISNNGLNDQTGVTFSLEIFEAGTSAGTWVSNQTMDTPSLTKDTLSVVTDFVPDMVGEIMIECTAVSTVVDDNPADDMASKSMMMTENIYARDANAAQAFVLMSTDEMYGNLFGIHANDFFGGIDVAIGAGSDEGVIIQGQLFEYDGLDADGLPVLSDVNNSLTVQHIVTADDLNGVGENNFVTLGFEEGALELEAGITYLAVIVNLDNGDLRIPVSGPNTWPASWILSDGSWGWTGSIPMVRLNGDETVSVNETASVNNVTLGQNIPNPATGSTVINYSLPSSEQVSIIVRDMTGRIVMTQDLGKQAPGAQRYEMNVSALSSGMYTYSLTAGETTLTKEMIVR
jgi:Secretion system C-terminal sorting domain